MTGSIEKRGKNSYRLVVFKGYDLDGRPIRHQKTIHCKKKSEAQIELAKFLTEVESGLIVDGNIPTFAQYVEIWTKDYALKELAPSTYYRYKRMLETSSPRTPTTRRKKPTGSPPTRRGSPNTPTTLPAKRTR